MYYKGKIFIILLSPNGLASKKSIKKNPANYGFFFILYLETISSNT
ncbi:hypothetical protein M2E15_2802 [Bacillus mycoides]|nr:hypothetical protein M2E15_2802 [Bacillus mycoides]OSX91546.1 hypothetical protein BTJ45_03230 [Bacillus mycoides]